MANDTKTTTVFKLDDPALLPTLREELAARPDDMQLLRAYGLLLYRLGDREQGETLLRQALAIDPEDAETRTALGICLLSLGKFAEGWPLYSARGGAGFARTGVPRGLTMPRWQGEPLDGKRVTIVPEQGMGDQMQFVRYVPLLAQMGAEVTMLVLPPLIRLFTASFPNVTIMPADGKVKLPPTDYWATTMDLPIQLHGKSGIIPPVPYLTPVTRWSQPPAGLKIGLMTKGNPRFINDSRRSLSPELAAMLASRLPGTIIELQPEETGVKDFADTAAIIAELDLVVSVDTGVAHLAGAMGKPAFVLLPGFNPDWRWMRADRPSPWYPEHRLYLSEIDDWRGAIERLAADVDTFVSRPDRPAAQPLPPPDPSPPFSKGWHEMLEVTRRAAANFPNDGRAQHLLGLCLTQMGDLTEGEHYLREAVRLSDDPKLHFELAHNLLAQGRYAEGWPAHRVRSKVEGLNIGYPNGPAHRHWNGEPLDGKHIVILPEQGLGDQIQFARLFPLLIERGARVTLFAKEPELYELFRHSFPNLTVRPTGGQIALSDFDYWSTPLDIAEHLGITLENLPAEPYLSTPQRWQGAPDGFKVGVQTSGSATHVRDGLRSLSPAWARYLEARLPGTVIPLDPRRTGAQSLAQTAAVIDQLDLVVTVDTSIAHLAGAMGKRTFLLLSGFAPDWRWLTKRTDSPWYPSMTIYRGDRDNYWKNAIDRAIADAQAMAALAPFAPVTHPA